MSLISEALRKARTDAALRGRGGDQLPDTVRLVQHVPPPRTRRAAGPIALAGFGLLLMLGACLVAAIPSVRQAIFSPPRPAMALEAGQDQTETHPRPPHAASTGTEPATDADPDPDLSAPAADTAGHAPTERTPPRRPAADTSPGDVGGADQPPQLIHIPLLHEPPAEPDPASAAAGHPPATEPITPAPATASAATAGPLDSLDAVPPPPSSLTPTPTAPDQSPAASGADDSPAIATGHPAEPTAKPGTSASSPGLVAGRAYRKHLDLPDLPPLRLDGITWSGPDRPGAALINGMVVRAGEEIDGYEVLTIERRRVQLRWEGTEFFLVMP